MVRAISGPFKVLNQYFLSGHRTFGRRGNALLFALFGGALLGAVILVVSGHLLFINRTILEVQVATQFKFLERTLDKVFRDTALCNAALKNETWSAGTNMSIKVPGFAQPLQTGEPSGPAWAPYLNALNVAKVEMGNVTVINAPQKQYQGVLTVELTKVGIMNVGLGAKALRFSVSFVDDGTGKISSCMGASLNLGVCTNVGEFVKGIDSNGNFVCGTPMDIILNMKCNGGESLWGYDFVNNKPHCKQLDNVPVITGAPCPPGQFIRGFDWSGNIRCEP